MKGMQKKKSGNQSLTQACTRGQMCVLKAGKLTNLATLTSSKE